jgi:hypothetical protein
LGTLYRGLSRGMEKRRANEDIRNQRLKNQNLIPYSGLYRNMVLMQNRCGLITKRIKVLLLKNMSKSMENYRVCRSIRISKLNVNTKDLFITIWINMVSN